MDPIALPTNQLRSALADLRPRLTGHLLDSTYSLERDVAEYERLAVLPEPPGIVALAKRIRDFRIRLVTNGRGFLWFLRVFDEWTYRASWLRSRTDSAFATEQERLAGLVPRN